MTEVIPMRDPLGKAFPNSVALEGVYDAERLSRELKAFDRHFGSPLSAASGRRVLPLRSVGGDPHRTDSGGPSLSGFGETPWLARLPYLRKLLEDLPAPLLGVRLMALAPGARLSNLQSVKCGPPWGLCRLHLPIVSGPRARTVFAGENRCWDPGTLWFVASWRVHAMVNREPFELVHLVVDTCHTDGLSRMFPQQLRQRLDGVPSLSLRPQVPLRPADAQGYRCRFRMPETFANWEQPGHHLPRDSGKGLVTAEVDVHEGVPRLLLDSRPFCSLEHIGEGEFRLCGWSDERTLQVVGTNESRVVLLRTREGSSTYRVRLPALPPTSEE
ncbi:aspartyl/asparaginyl beta-hydroxylase domain-containing protein [Streptomyces bathyalis]|uniref:Aspartyl/asparaginyl beta-hydroxylase domain-containing protein n=1 Tax=Streptomyces bathyalis TaxID=2710756 RepID=A0A7T1T3W3_9ACTN|nr:aspartyl/asparaginyl beta-hydroxylase domain-containing protein [Streptomyces bathyalis]QPP05840.1 aspartyl/asparaginyl beta-hydroxylase domain-containing protein [Streptomyces bathyalis]